MSRFEYLAKLMDLIRFDDAHIAKWRSVQALEAKWHNVDYLFDGMYEVRIPVGRKPRVLIGRGHSSATAARLADMAKLYFSCDTAALNFGLEQAKQDLATNSLARGILESIAFELIRQGVLTELPNL